MGLFDFIKKIPTLNEIQGSLGEWAAKMYAKTMPDALVLRNGKNGKFYGCSKFPKCRYTVNAEE